MSKLRPGCFASEETTRVFIYEENKVDSESKCRFAVKKKSSKVPYKILLLSNSTFFKLFFHIFAAITEALIVRLRPPITQMSTDSVIESLKSDESAVTDQKL